MLINTQVVTFAKTKKMKKILTLAAGLFIIGNVSTAQNTAQTNKSSEKSAAAKPQATSAANAATPNSLNAKPAASAAPAAAQPTQARPAAANRAHSPASAGTGSEPAPVNNNKPADAKKAK